MSSAVFTLHATDGKLPARAGDVRCERVKAAVRVACPGVGPVLNSEPFKATPAGRGRDGGFSHQDAHEIWNLRQPERGGWSVAGLQRRGQWLPLLSVPPGVCVSAVTAWRLVGKRGPTPVHRLPCPPLSHGCKDTRAATSPPCICSGGN